MPSAMRTKRARQGVEEHGAEGATFGDARGERVGQRDADEEGEAGLNGVVERADHPIGVGLVVGEKAPEGAAGKGFGDARELEDLGHHEEHDKAVVGIDGEIGAVFSKQLIG